MASINELPPDQVAVLRLLLGQGSSYASIASSLHIQEREVRRRAEAALDSLASVEPPPSRERDEVTDYLLGQQDAGAQEETRKLLASSAAAGAWARSLKEPLAELGGTSLPVIPSSGSAARISGEEDGMGTAAATAVTSPAKPVAGKSPSGGQRRSGRILLAAVGALAILAIGLLVGRATAPDSSGTSGSASGTNVSQGDAQGRVIAAAQLKPPPGSPAGKALGIAQFARQQNQTILGVAAQDMPKAAKGSGYGVWLTGGSSAPLWLGYFSAVNNKGQVGAQTVVPVSPTAYKTMLITLESTKNPKSPGKTYLSGAITTGG